MNQPAGHAGRYKANFSKGGLMVPESRVVADLLLQGVDPGRWQQAIAVENVLAKRSPSTALTKANLIRARLRAMPASLWTLIRDGSRSVATQATLAATVSYSPLFGDFLDLVVRDLYRRFEPRLKRAHWDQYLADCKTRDAQMPDWSEATRTTLRTRAFGMLREAGFLSADRACRLQTVMIEAEVKQALRAAERWYALRCIGLSERDAPR
ncbi:DUF1819 family protein [Halochromatium roseum]|uniref:DUF1819 family protein n=1 Tax=Halochromatium roseum TaxID=391920 RepID=UPI001912844E|nr:DUF1819 family protein [Halochromatium roseum]